MITNKIAVVTLGIALGVVTFFASCSGDKSTTPGEYVCTGTPGVLCNVAGKAKEPGAAGNGGDGLNATLYWVADVTVDKEGNILIVDFNNHCIRKIDRGGIISNFEGSGMLGDDPTGPALTVNMNHPTGITQDNNGDYWIASWHNWKLKKIDHATMEVSSPVGTSQGFSGDGGPAGKCQTNLPSSIVFDESNNLYFSDQGNQRIRKVDLSTMIVTTVAGSTKGMADGVGAAAKFSFPVGSNAGPGGKICMSPDKLFIYIADTENNLIRKLNVRTGEVTTVAGTGTAGSKGDGGQATVAELNHPTDVCMSAGGILYIADSKNHTIRKIDANGIITTCAGVPGVAGYSDNGTKATSAKLNTPRGVCITSGNILYIADTYNNQVKKVVDP